MNLWVKQIYQIAILRCFDEGRDVPVAFCYLLDLVEQHGFADATQAQQHLRLRGSPEQDALKSSIRGGNYFRTACQFWWLRACAGREGIADWIHIYPFRGKYSFMRIYIGQY